MTADAYTALLSVVYFGIGLLWAYTNMQELPRSTPVALEFLFFTAGVLFWPAMVIIIWYLDSRR